MSDSFDPTATETSTILREGLHLVVFGSDGAKGYRVPPGGSLTIGQSTECDVRVDTPSMSRKHFTVRDASPTQIEDLGGRNGTRVNGRAIETGAAAAFELGSLIEAGGAFFTMQDHPPREFARLPTRADTPPTPVSGPAGTVVRDPAMVRLHELIDAVARSDIPVLVLGETGVGKEVLAEAVHRAIAARARPFVTPQLRRPARRPCSRASCSATSAAPSPAPSRAKPGCSRSAHGGTVFLDEVGEMPLATQAKLLRVLESGEVMRLGALKPRRIDVRFIAATNRDLAAHRRERGVPAGPLLPAQRHHDPHPAAARAEGGDRAARALLRSSCRVQRAATPTPRARRRRCSQCSRRTRGRATSASCATSSSAPWCSCARRACWLPST